MKNIPIPKIISTRKEKPNEGKPLRVLIIEDSENDTRLILRRLKKDGYNPLYERVKTAFLMKKALKEKQWDIILCGYKLPNFGALSAITVLKKANIDIPVIVVAGAIGEATAAKCMRLGAKDYIMKRNMSRLCPAIARELEDAKVRNKEKLVEEKLRDKEKRFRAFVEHSSDIIVILNLEGIITYINPAVEKVLGFKPEERIGAKGFELIHLDDMKFVTDSFNTLARNTNFPIIHSEIHLRHKDRSWRTLEVVGSNLVRNNVVESVIVNYRDITERKRAEEELRKSEGKYRDLVKYAPAGIYEYDYETNLFINVNDVICEYTGYTRDELLTMKIFNLLTEESQKLMLERLEKLMTNEKITQTVEYCIRTKGGEELWVRLSARYIYKSGKLKGATGVVYNITERKQAEDVLKESEKKYRELSIKDDLTQFYNSKHFYGQLEREIERSNRYEQPLTLLLLDLDKFKDFNDTYGHVKGDYVLSRFGQVVKRCLRETDSAYRYGGDEFTIILPMTTSEEGIVTAKRIQTELMKEAFPPTLDQEVHMTVSIGLAQYKLKEEMKGFVHRVDQLMYQAKQNGRDRICPDS